eukprot:SAG31_NODE_1033_length_10230_cov_15.289014_11_plen_86_part_00
MCQFCSNSFETIAVALVRNCTQDIFHERAQPSPTLHGDVQKHYHNGPNSLILRYKSYRTRGLLTKVANATTNYSRAASSHLLHCS